MNEYKVVKEKTSILITQNTVKLKGVVYQTCNIASFEFGSYRLPAIVPYWFIIALSLLSISLISGMDSFYKTLGYLMLFIAVASLFINLSRLQKDGFLLELTSGRSCLFICQNSRQGRQVVYEIYEFLEKGKSGEYYIQISESTIQGNIISGNVDGNVNSISG